MTIATKTLPLTVTFEEFSREVVLAVKVKYNRHEVCCDQMQECYTLFVAGIHTFEDCVEDIYIDTTYWEGSW